MSRFLNDKIGAGDLISLFKVAVEKERTQPLLRNSFFSFSILVVFLLMLFSFDFNEPLKKETVSPVFESNVFKDTLGLQIKKGYDVQILFQEGDTVMVEGGAFASAKGNHDATVFIPTSNSSEKGFLFVGHETNDKNKIIGDGGSSTIMEVKKNNYWEVVGVKRSTSYADVGGTINNCGAFLTPFNTILSAEEIYPVSNKEIASGFGDTSNYNGHERYLNYGYIVELDPVNNKVLRKHKKMGRFVHEHAYIDSMNQTVYLTNDDSPAVFFKYEYEKNDLGKGTLFAMKEKEGAVTWITMKDDDKTLYNARDEAIKLGATMFLRHEWITKVKNKLYITETGYDKADFSKYIKMGGAPASYFNVDSSGVAFDPYGRIIEYDLEKETIKPFVEGGSLKGGKHFSNPDCIVAATDKEHDFLIVCEDIIAKDKGRSTDSQKVVNDVFMITLNKNGGVKQIEKIITSVPGSEATGAYFTPDHKNMFLNIQHPATAGNGITKSSTVVVTGF